MEAQLKTNGIPKPWLTLGFSLSIICLGFLSGPIADRLLFQRFEILHGQMWRLWTAHGMHFGWSHLTWNLLVFIIAATWLEGLSRRALLGVILLGPLVISGGLILCSPLLTTYAGLSGVDTALIAALGILSLRLGALRIGLSLLALLLFKIGAEYQFNSSLFTSFDDPSIRSVPLSHLFGLLAGIMIGLAPRQWLRIAKADGPGASA